MRLCHVCVGTCLNYIDTRISAYWPHGGNVVAAAAVGVGLGVGVVLVVVVLLLLLLAFPRPTEPSPLAL